MPTNYSACVTFKAFFEFSELNLNYKRNTVWSFEHVTIVSSLLDQSRKKTDFW
jgi:hypothetical protein